MSTKRSHRRGSKHGIDWHEYCCNARLYCKRGTDLPQSKLDAAKVREIRAIYRCGDSEFGQRGLAKKYGVHQRTIEKVVNYETWIHVCAS